MGERKYFKCPECGEEDFEALFHTHDTALYLCGIYEDGSYDMLDLLEDEVDDTELATSNFKCMKCGNIVDIYNLPKDDSRCEDIWEEK